MQSKSIKKNWKYERNEKYEENKEHKHGEVERLLDIENEVPHYVFLTGMKREVQIIGMGNL